MPNTPNLNGFRRTSPKSESESTQRTRDSYENEKLKERIKMLENDQKQQNKENQILNLENKRLREENKRILDKHKVSFYHMGTRKTFLNIFWPQSDEIIAAVSPQGSSKIVKNVTLR